VVLGRSFGLKSIFFAIFRLFIKPATKEYGRRNALFGAALVIFVSSEPGVVLGSYALLLLFSVILFIVYRKAYRCGNFDLLTERSPRRG